MTIPPVEIPLKLKYRVAGASKRQHSSYGGRNRSSAGKHTAHPDVFAYRRNNYRCEPKWNVKPQPEVTVTDMPPS